MTGSATKNGKVRRGAGGAAPKVRGARAQPERMIPFSTFVEFRHQLDCLITDKAVGDVESCGAYDLATFIDNQGTDEDRAEAVLALLPIASRVYEKF